MMMMMMMMMNTSRTNQVEKAGITTYDMLSD